MGDRSNVNVIVKSGSDYRVTNFYSHYSGSDFTTEFARFVTGAFLSASGLDSKLDEFGLTDVLGRDGVRFADESYALGALTTWICREFGSVEGLGFGISTLVTDNLETAICAQQDNEYAIVSLVIDLDEHTYALYAAENFVGVSNAENRELFAHVLSPDAVRTISDTGLMSPDGSAKLFEFTAFERFGLSADISLAEFERFLGLLR